MSQLIGRFYFKKTSAGNLLGEYSNRVGTQIYAEAATRLENGQTWVGQYITTWCEASQSGSPATEHKFVSTKLEICEKQTSSGIFSLTWSNPKQGVFFTGEAMLCDDIMVGDYTG